MPTQACNGRSRSEAAAVDLPFPVNRRVQSNGELVDAPTDRLHHRVDRLIAKGDKFAHTEKHIPVLLMTLA